VSGWRQASPEKWPSATFGGLVAHLWRFGAVGWGSQQVRTGKRDASGAEILLPQAVVAALAGSLGLGRAVPANPSPPREAPRTPVSTAVAGLELVIGRPLSKDQVERAAPRGAIARRPHARTAPRGTQPGLGPTVMQIDGKYRRQVGVRPHPG
jgi:hypothetical protein